LSVWNLTSKKDRAVCLSIWSINGPECTSKTTKEQWQLTATEIERRANFPHCLLMGHRWETYSSNQNGTQGLDILQFQGFFSVVLMAVADTDYHFVYVDIGSYGKDCDSTIFKRSTLWTSIQTNMLKLPVRDLLEERKVQMYHVSL